jgi:hypothetical protein
MIYKQRSILEIVSQRHIATHPHALLTRSFEFVANSFSRAYSTDFGQSVHVIPAT